MRPVRRRIRFGSFRRTEPVSAVLGTESGLAHRDPRYPVRIALPAVKA